MNGAALLINLLSALVLIASVFLGLKIAPFLRRVFFMFSDR